MVMGMQSLNIALCTRAMEQREAATGLSEAREAADRQGTAEQPGFAKQNVPIKMLNLKFFKELNFDWEQKIASIRITFSQALEKELILAFRESL